MMKPRQNGFTLIEVLMSVFVLALGVIGAAGMQLTALRTTHQSGFQTAAVELASEMADTMRANDVQMKLADGQNPFLQIDYISSPATLPAGPATQCDTAGVNCNPEQLAASDIYTWERHADVSLPGARVRICRDAEPWNGDAGRFNWTCDASSNNAPVVIKIGWQGKNTDGSLIRDAVKEFPPSVALTVEPYTR